MKVIIQISYFSIYEGILNEPVWLIGFFVDSNRFQTKLEKKKQISIKNDFNTFWLHFSQQHKLWNLKRKSRFYYYYFSFISFSRPFISSSKPHLLENWKKKFFFSHNFQQVWFVWHISWWSSIHCWLWTIFNSTLSLKISFWCILMGVICGSFNKVWLEMPSNTMIFLSSSTIKSILGWHLQSTPEIIQNYGLNFLKVVQFYFHLFFIQFLFTNLNSNYFLKKIIKEEKDTKK